MTRILAWHFLPASRRLINGDGRLVVAGETLSVERAPEMCMYGMHASPRILGALTYQRGPMLCRVRVSGDVKREGGKIVGRHRKCLWMINASLALRMFAADCSARWPNLPLLPAYHRQRPAHEIAEVVARQTLTAAYARGCSYGDKPLSFAMAAADAERAWQSRRLRALVGALRRGETLEPLIPLNNLQKFCFFL